MNEISISDLMKLSNPIIIDIRDKYSYNLGHLNKSLNIPYYSLLSNYSIYLNKQDTYYLYCDSGMKSRRISRELNMKGYSTVNIQGGYHNYLLMK